MIHSLTRTAICVFAVMLCGGCGPDRFEGRPKLHRAQGTLTINGKPAEGAMLILHYAGKLNEQERWSGRATAVADENGAFQVTTFQSGDGAPEGEYLVTILWVDNPEASSSWDKLDDKFSNPRESKIRVSIQPGQEQLEPIVLDGVRVLEKRPRPAALDKDGLE